MIYIYIHCVYSTYSLYCLWNAVDLCGSLGSNKVVFTFFPLPWNQCSLLTFDLAQGKPLTSTTAALLWMLWWSFQCVYKHRSLMFNRLFLAHLSAERGTYQSETRHRRMESRFNIHNFNQEDRKLMQASCRFISPGRPLWQGASCSFKNFDVRMCEHIWDRSKIS